MTGKIAAALIAWSLCGGIGHAQTTSTATTKTTSARQAKSAAKTPTTPVNLNAATSVELEVLPGVGKATAARIIEYRQKNGGFKKIEDLMNVRGIGEKSFLKLKPFIVVGPAKTPGR